MTNSPRILLIGIGGVHNYGCEAIVRGTERVLHEQWPRARIVYASCRPAEDAARLRGCPVEIVPRRCLGRYSARNVLRKLLSKAGIAWHPISDPPATADGYDAVLSIGGDIYTVRPNGVGNRGFLRFGDACERRGVPYVLWGASVGPFPPGSETERVFIEHLKNISLLTVREPATVDYLRTFGVCDNVVPCADPAYVVAPEITADPAPERRRPTIGVNLSPLSALHAGYSLAESLPVQARTLQALIEAFDPQVVLIPHVVCAGVERDDDQRYLQRLERAIESEYRGSVSLLGHDLGFVGTKMELKKCDLVLATRMHCAINALAAHVPTILLSYSRKAEGMCRYIYGNSEWTVPLTDFLPDHILPKVDRLLSQRDALRSYLARRIPEIQDAAFRPAGALKDLLEGRATWRAGSRPGESEAGAGDASVRLPMAD